MDFEDGLVAIVRWASSIITFLLCWAYAVSAWGWFLGLSLGWIPSIIFAAVIWFFAPALAVLAIILAVGIWVVQQFS